MNLNSILILGLVTLCCIAHAQSEPCRLQKGMNQVQCAKLTRQFCPVRFLTYGCPASKMKIVKNGDGGCQPSNSCPYCCKAGCARGKKKDSRCQWTGNECIICDPKLLVNNGLPILPNPNGGQGVLPVGGWDNGALGDTFKIHQTCSSLGQYVTGITLWVKQMNPLLESVPVTELDVRLTVLNMPGEIVNIDWLGDCQVKPFLSWRGIFQVDCDLTTGTHYAFIPPTSCVPALASGDYNLVFSHKDSPTLGWLASFPNTGCHQQSFSQCAFSQSFASGNRVDLCAGAGDRQLENLAFQIRGQTTAPLCFDNL